MNHSTPNPSLQDFDYAVICPALKCEVLRSRQLDEDETMGRFPEWRWEK